METFALRFSFMNDIHEATYGFRPKFTNDLKRLFDSMNSSKEGFEDGKEIVSSRDENPNTKQEEFSDSKKESRKVTQKLSSLKGKTKPSKPKNKKKAEDMELNLDEYNFGGFKYKTPGRRQRIIVASLVLSLNLILALGVILYFKNPAFKDFIFNVGR